MASNQGRASVAVLALMVLWVIVYWWTPVPQTGYTAVTFDPEVVGPGARVDEAELRKNEPVAKPPASDASKPPLPVQRIEGAVEPERMVGVIPPTFRPYVVQGGDTAESISKKLYGTRDHWKSIAQANPFVDFMHLKKGQEIRVPVDPDNVQGVKAPGELEALVQVKEYTVEAGDSLSKIAEQEYGQSKLWTMILEANRTQLGDDPTSIKPGMKLRIPPKPSEETEGAGRP
ncbi:MAG TPA: LysM peptidoglycan-binding domain-containing protein [Phycisphaerales bacterium]|nr:LysM peptidoglycan-binding domain-containing protein [Phycisphaerales bacterium]